MIPKPKEMPKTPMEAMEHLARVLNNMTPSQSSMLKKMHEIKTNMIGVEVSIHAEEDAQFAAHWMALVYSAGANVVTDMANKMRESQ